MDERSGSGDSMSGSEKSETDPGLAFAENSVAYTDAETHDLIVIRINK